MVLKSYFDGGNKVEPQFDQISLGMVFGTSNQWRRFERDWGKVGYRDKAPPLHTTDAVSLRNDFSAENGWDEVRVDAFMNACVDVIEKHIVIPFSARFGLLPVTLTIKFDEWLRARKTNPTIADTIEETCATQALSLAFKWGTFIGARRYEMFFDRGEPFYGHIYTRWVHPKAREDMRIMQKVTTVSPVVAADVPAMQMADLFAWGVNKANQETRIWHKRLHKLEWDSLRLDYEQLINPNPRAQEMIASWKLPKRRPSEKALIPK